MGFRWFYEVSLGFTEFYLDLASLIWFLPGCTYFGWFSLGFNEFD